MVALMAFETYAGFSTGSNEWAATLELDDGDLRVRGPRPYASRELSLLTPFVAYWMAAKSANVGLGIEKVAS
jgi:hypothetical protein